MKAPGRPALFLDRDGTLMEERHYCSRPEEVVLIHGVRAALEDAWQHGWALVLVTNQSGIGRGFISLAEYRAVHEAFMRLLHPVVFDSVEMCPSAPPTEDPDRKPKPGMLLRAAQKLQIDLKRSWTVGDKASDLEAGRAAGTRVALVHTGYGLKTKAEVSEESMDLQGENFPEVWSKIRSAFCS
ncbi:MAG: D-glycero-alpha-D-manno-heptose-1,7-bisphosphate 7-phosphatase [Verrucomicrobiales bacterium]